MPDFDVLTASGTRSEKVTGPDHLFGLEPNVPVMHQVVTAQLAARRQGTQSTKTRAEVRGGGAKPWRQKGTGRARAGSTRAPHWRGGGVALGPKPRSYAQKTPKKMKRLALASALSDRAADDKVRVLDSFGLAEPKTKDAIALLTKIQVHGRILLVVDHDDQNAVKSFNNLVGVNTITQDQLNTYDVLVNDFVVFTKDTFEAACSFRPAPEERTAARLDAALAVAHGTTDPTADIEDSEDAQDAANSEASEEE